MYPSVLVFQDTAGSFVVTLSPGQIRTITASTSQIESIQAQLDRADQKDWISWALVADGATSPPAAVRVVNGDTLPLKEGMPIASVGGLIVRATAASIDHAKVLGIVVSSGDPGQTALIRTAGVVERPDWSDVIEEDGGMLASEDYYLSLVPGNITRVPPSAQGTSSALIGTTLSTTQLELRLSFPFLQ